MKELREYMYKIDQVDDPFCDCGLGVEQTIKHVLCDCPTLARTRALESDEQVTLQHMTTHPEMCRRILSQKFTGLSHTQKLAEEAQDVGRVRPQGAPQAPVRAVPDQIRSAGSDDNAMTVATTSTNDPGSAN